MEKATAIVAMGGYNTFCEILTLDKPALIVPRSVPRQEQLIRAERAVKLNLVSLLDPAGERDPLQMAAAIRALPEQATLPRQMFPACSQDTKTSLKWYASISNLRQTKAY